MKHKVLMALAALATLFASFTASSACLWAFYQPEEPKSLREK
ncbi:cyclic lactone autoinducer peptide [Niameybacter massiliensis]|uniref:Cyclic lactone autoinducer peptide n=1 Tax=Holtiella tumoricola TaxID=3018743 RepID=A0AA42DL33_9FIRM|nr:cyclic lactone autoinducer peptide [Holtiella tumoricola]MDA3730825.1 cyclic lactone autoinducer peptide [Holtiella tumoricola]